MSAQVKLSFKSWSTQEQKDCAALQVDESVAHQRLAQVSFYESLKLRFSSEGMKQLFPFLKDLTIKWKPMSYIMWP